MNSVKLYSNGTAVISRLYPLDGNETRISIPVKKDDLDEVVASISVFGDVALPVPPSYTPTNANATSLSIDAKNVTKDLATKLAGSQVEVQAGGKKYTGKLVGVQEYQQETNGSVFDRFRLVLLTSEGIVAQNEQDIVSLKFLDETVQTEIDKALQRSFQAIKPDSSFVDLTVVPNNGAKSAVVAYATPVAAWKIRYTLRFVKGACELEGQAVVDNDTDDDWKDAIISVITGDPIAFKTDLAETRRPKRDTINLVADRATGAVGVEDEMPKAPTRTRGAVGRQAKLMTAAPASFGGGPEAVMDYDEDVLTESAEAMYAGTRAVQTQAEVRDSGDFSVFTSPNPVSVGAKKSAIIPMFTCGLKDAKTILFYKEQNDPRRPFRAVKLKNETIHSLGRGVCEIFLDGDFQGKCVLEATKPNEEVFLVHAKETGVKVFKELSPVESRRIAIRIKNGVAVCEHLSRRQATYLVKNSKPESFEFEIEHHRLLPDSKITVNSHNGQLRKTDIPSGARIGATLQAGSNQDTADLVVEVEEVSVHEQNFSISPAWLQQNIVLTKNPLGRNKTIQKCVELQGKLDEIQSQIEEAEQAVETALEEQKRLQDLIKAGHSEQANEWKTDLANLEKEIRKNKRETLPSLQKQQKQVQAELQEALADLSANWSEKKEEEVEAK